MFSLPLPIIHPSYLIIPYHAPAAWPGCPPIGCLFLRPVDNLPSQIRSKRGTRQRIANQLPAIRAALAGKAHHRILQKAFPPKKENSSRLANNRSIERLSGSTTQAHGRGAKETYDPKVLILSIVPFCIKRGKLLSFSLFSREEVDTSCHAQGSSFFYLFHPSSSTISKSEATAQILSQKKERGKSGVETQIPSPSEHHS
mmetsp:Transcript_29121/g.86216  ORF Transcript_29121/g.86216 Transcript_29121/m.86216 type:complete len:200 (+) Transcript_29121:316-915(+)